MREKIKTNPKKLKLTIEGTILPSVIDGDKYRFADVSLFSELKFRRKFLVWKKLKEELFKKEGRKCWICGAKNARLHAHEFWLIKNFNNAPSKKEKVLIAIHHLCPKCHMVKHFDKFSLSQKEAKERINDLDFLCKKKNPQELKKDIRKNLETKRRKFWGKNPIPEITKEDIQAFKECLELDCPKKEEIKEKIKQRRKITKKLIKHFYKVNRCSKRIFEKHWEKVQKRIKKIRQDGIFFTDYGKYENCLNQRKNLPPNLKL